MRLETESEEETQFWDFVACIDEALRKYKGKIPFEFSHKQRIHELEHEIQYACTSFMIHRIGVAGSTMAQTENPFKYLMHCLRMLEIELTALGSKRLLPLIRGAIDSGVKIKGMEVIVFKKSHKHRFFRGKPSETAHVLTSVVEESKTLT